MPVRLKSTRVKCPCPRFRVSRARSHETLRHRSQDRGAERKIPTVVGCEIRRCRVGRYSRGYNLSRQVSSTASLRRTSTPVSSAVSTAHVVESTDVSAFPAEVIDVKTGVEEPPVAVQATAPFLPVAEEKEIVRNVTEKRLLHRVLSRHRAQIDSDLVLRAPRRKQFHYCTKWCRCAEILFHPAVLSEIARDVKEKRLLHRFFIATQSPHRIRTCPTSSQTECLHCWRQKSPRGARRRKGDCS